MKFHARMEGLGLGSIKKIQDDRSEAKTKSKAKTC